MASSGPLPDLTHIAAVLSTHTLACLHCRIRSLHGAPCGLLVSFFGPDQSGKLGLKEFKAFLSALNEELLKLEFQHYMPDVRGQQQQVCSQRCC